MTGFELKKLRLRAWINHVLKLASFAAFLLVTNVQADVLRCVDDNGRTTFTDNHALCRESEIASVVTDVGVRNSTVDKGKVNYRIPKRQYEALGSNYKIFIERDLVEGDSKLAEQATEKLETTLKEIFAVLPEVPANKLSQLTFYVMWGESSPKGGRKSGMSYIRPGEPNNYAYLDTRWENVIVIYSAKNLMYLDSLWSKKALMHELAHAWHLNNWPEDYEPIVNAYRKAKDLGLYRDVKDNKGKIIKEAYAIKNHLEYFAELSAMYFVGGNYYPLNKLNLRMYDMSGFQMLESGWSYFSE